MPMCAFLLSEHAMVIMAYPERCPESWPLSLSYDQTRRERASLAVDRTIALNPGWVPVTSSFRGCGGRGMHRRY